MLGKEMEELKGQEETKIVERNAFIGYKIKVKDMPEESSYNWRNLERKHVQK